MILVCPNCETRYEIPVELPPEGRKVRCSACQHVWQATEADAYRPTAALPDFESDEVIFRDDPERAVRVPEQAAAEADAFSDAAMEEAFSEAVKEAELHRTQAEDGADAPATDEEPGEDQMPDEVESPPIVIGKAKKRRVLRPGPAAAGWLALAAFVAGTAAFAYFQRVEVVRALPGAAPAYARLGLPVNVRGLAFEQVGYSWEIDNGLPVLEVHGDIVNVTPRPLKVPAVVFGLRTGDKVEVYQWAADVRAEPLPPGERTQFAAQIPTPPKSIRDVLVRFAKVR